MNYAPLRFRLVIFSNPVIIGGRVRTGVTFEKDGVDGIMSRPEGIRIAADEEITFVPWHNVKWAVER